jgi:hypothetical protein
MFTFPINVHKDKKISITQNSDYLEETMYAEKLAEKVIEQYKELVNELDKKNYKDVIDSKNKKKDVELCWKIGKIIYEFMEWAYDEAVEVPNLPTALSKSITGTTLSWELCFKFYARNRNKEYITYPWFLCSALATTNRSKTREALVQAFKDKKVKNQNEVYLLKYIIEYGEPKELAESRKNILEALSKKDLTEAELAEATGLSKDSVRGRVSELNGLHCYEIEKNDGYYHLVSNEKERKQKIREYIEYAKVIKC